MTMDLDGAATIRIGPLTVRISKEKDSVITPQESLEAEKTALQKRIEEIDYELGLDK